MGKSSETDILAEVRNLSGQNFETLVASLWELQGWTTTVTDAVGDEGRDVIAERKMPFTMKIKIEAKGWSERNVTGPDVRKYALLPGDDAEHAVIVTSSSFTEPAKEAARRNDVKLVDGIVLVNLIRKLDADGLLVSEVDLSDWDKVKPETYIDWSVGVPGKGERVTVMPGIGDTYAERLSESNIHTVGDLLTSDPDRVVDQTGLSASRIERWINLAAFHQGGARTDAIEGVGQEEVEQLAEAGIYTVDGLLDACAKTVARQTDLSEYNLKKWIGDAARREVTSVYDLPDIGEARAKTLATVGIFTESDLATAAPSHVASRTDLSVRQVKKWVRQASPQ